MAAAADEIDEPPRRTYYLLERGLIPAGKLGNVWIASRRALRRHYAELTTAAAFLLALLVLSGVTSWNTPSISIATRSPERGAPGFSENRVWRGLVQVARPLAPPGIGHNGRPAPLTGGAAAAA
jgi:hypothetical protein